MTDTLKPRYSVASLGAGAPDSLWGLNTRTVEVLAGGLIAINAVQALSALDDVKEPLVAIVALVAALWATFDSVRPARDPFPADRAWTIVVIHAVASIAVTANYAHLGWPGFASWNLGAASTAILFLGLRGRLGLAWLGSALVIIPVWVWVLATGQTVTLAVKLSQMPLTLVVGATVFGSWITRALRKAHSLADATARMEAERQASLSARSTRELAQVRVAAAVQPVLQRVLAVGAIDDDDVRDALVAENALRDAMHAPGLVSAETMEILAAARSREIRVRIRDDGDLPASEAEMAALTPLFASVLADAEGGTVTFRRFSVGPSTRFSCFPFAGAQGPGLWQWDGREWRRLDETRAH